MPDALASALGDFHFLRPLWLLVLVPIAINYALMRWRTSARAQWKQLIAPHLLEHLLVGRGSSGRVRPEHLTTALLAIGTLAVAGPTWQREVSPFAEDTAPLVIALDLSQSMNAVDVPPTRLERAKQKVHDLLDARRGARTSLIAYAGTAHSVLPLSDDPTIFATFLDALTSEVMPRPGKTPSAALELAEETLSGEEVPGSILFITDGIGADDAPRFEQHADSSDDGLLVLAIGTTDGGPIPLGDNRFATDASGRRIIATLDRDGLEAVRDRAGAYVVSATADDTDVQRLERRVQSNLQRARQDDETSRWQDAGYWLTLPLALLGALWFRRGWTVRWSFLGLVLLLGLANIGSPATAAVRTVRPTALPSGESTPPWQEPPPQEGGAGSQGTGSTPPGAAQSEAEASQDAPSEDSDAAFRFIDLWLTRDQQGRRLFERGDYAAAADTFEDPMWRGVAAYRAGDLDAAVDAFAADPSPEAAYDFGNAQARLGNYEEAIASYQQALADRPDWVEARENRDLVQAILDAQADDPPQGNPGQPTFAPDELQFDEQGQQGQRGEVDVQQLTDEQIADMWMRRLQTSPADFLRRRFAVEVSQRGETQQPGGQR